MTRTANIRIKKWVEKATDGEKILTYREVMDRVKNIDIHRDNGRPKKLANAHSMPTESQVSTALKYLGWGKIGDTWVRR